MRYKKWSPSVCILITSSLKTRCAKKQVSVTPRQETDSKWALMLGLSSYGQTIKAKYDPGGKNMS